MVLGMHVSTETKRNLGDQDRRWPAKFGMRIVATGLALIGTIIFAAVSTVSKKDVGGNDWTDRLPLGPLLMALLYNPFYLLTTIIRRGRSVHPGFSVTADLFVWALGVPAIILSLGDGWFWLWQPVYIRVGDTIPCNEFNEFSEHCSPHIYTLGRAEIAGNLFLGLVVLVHFVLFFFSCIATYYVRREQRSGAQSRRNIELTYHRDPQEHMQDQPSPPPTYSNDYKGGNNAGSSTSGRLSRQGQREAKYA